MWEVGFLRVDGAAAGGELRLRKLPAGRPSYAYSTRRGLVEYTHTHCSTRNYGTRTLSCIERGIYSELLRINLWRGGCGLVDRPRAGRGGVPAGVARNERRAAGGAGRDRHPASTLLIRTTRGTAQGTAQRLAAKKWREANRCGLIRNLNANRKNIHHIISETCSSHALFAEIVTTSILGGARVSGEFPGDLVPPFW